MSKEDEDKLEENQNNFNALILSVEIGLIAYFLDNIRSKKGLKLNISKAFIETGAKKIIEEATIEASINAINIGRKGSALGQELIVDKKAVRDFVLFDGRKGTRLFTTLKDPEYTRTIFLELNKYFDLERTWIEKSNKIMKHFKGDVPKSIQALESLKGLSKKANLTPPQLKEYFRVIGKAQSSVNRLALNNASQGQLRKAYQKVVDATLTGSKQGLERALRGAINEKMRYNAQTVARTESFFNYGESIKSEAFNNEDVGAIGFDLDPDHKIFDSCDGYASANLYGLGNGIYPKTFAPKLPIHPNGKSTLNEVDIDEVNGENATFKESGMIDYIKKNPDKQKHLLGVEGAKDFNADNSTWKANLKNWEEPTEFTKVIPT